MAAVATQTDLETFFGVDRVRSLFDFDKDGSADAAVVTAYIAAAQAELKRWFVDKQTMDEAAPPAEYVLHVCRFAAYLAASAHPGNLTDEMKLWRTDAIEWAKDTGHGRSEPSDGSGEPDAVPAIRGEAVEMNEPSELGGDWTQGTIGKLF